jgi:serine phosphatase RsbU (regulator of sigma subunit)
VASHHSLSQALLKQASDMRIEEVAAQINSDWPEDLPYFTMVLGEIDPRTGRGAIVQPAIRRRSDRPRRRGRFIGEGGLPGRLFPAAQYEPFRFEVGEGDRLVLYSTD